MKTPILFALAATVSLVHAALPSDELERRASVTLPFAEVKSLLTAPKPPVEPPPPIAAAVTSAKISVSLTGGKPSVIARIEVDILAKGWTLVPLIGSPFTLTSVAPAGIVVLPSEGMLCLLAKEPGHIALELRFEIPPALTTAGAAGLSLRLPAATTGRLEVLNVPEHCRALLRAGDFQGTSGSLPLPAEGGGISVRVVEDTPSKTITPTPWTTQVQTLIRAGDDRLQCESHVRLVGASGSGLSAKLELPADASAVEITGPDLHSWTLSTPSNAARVTELAWETPDLLERDLLIHYELPLPPGGEPWAVQPPRIPGAKSAIASTTLLPPPGIALSGAGGRQLDDAATLPRWMASRASASAPFQVDSAAPFTVEAHPLPRLEADTARIPEARFHTRIVSDGARLCEALIRLQHRGPLRWRFALPKGSELLTCEVNGRATNPILRKDGGLELLVATATADDSPARSEITFSFTTHSAALAPVEGKLNLALPDTPLFIEDLVWTLDLPGAYEATAFEGNVEPDGGGSSITFHKRLVRNEAASVEIYYRKRNANL